MGRTEKSQGLAPPAIRKDARAKQARHIINKTIPAILLSNSRAKQGAESSLLIVNPGVSPPHVDQQDGSENGNEMGFVQRKGQGRRKIKHGVQALAQDKVLGLDSSKLKHGPSGDAGSQSAQSSSLQSPEEMVIRIMWTDTLTAAAASTSSGPPSRATNKKQPNVCILNMASPLRPGGGVLNGATSQEEFLCARTTLLPSLKESFYRLPEIGGILTHDVLVFRNSRPLHDPLGEIPAAERFWIDAISSGMLRFPQLQGEEDDEEKSWSSKDRILVEAKMRAVLRIASHRGVKRLVLGAWGCGAYGNPVREVAEAWKKVIGRKNEYKKAEEDDVWSTIEEIVFAITDRAMADEFAHIFDKHVEINSDPDMDNGEEVEEEDNATVELRDKIRQLQGQLSGTQNPDLKSRLGLILDDLNMQLKQQERKAGSDSGNDE